MATVEKVAAPSPEKSTSTVTELKASKAEVESTTVTEPKKKSDSLRNPETGEVAKIPNNYRFSKRWIKEALVKEGFLDKIYKNNELNGESNAKIKQALAELQAMEKYKV